MAKDTSAVPLDEAVRAVRVSSRRRQVLDAAVTVMQRTGFHQMSMQALADEAQVSVGLIYKYFGGKEDILLATIVDILDAFRDQLEPAMDAAGTDPVERLVAGFRRYVEIVDENLDAVVLTYRESRTLDQDGRERIKELEVATSKPLHDALDAAIAAGIATRSRRRSDDVRHDDARARVGAQALAFRVPLHGRPIHHGANTIHSPHRAVGPERREDRHLTE